MESDSSQLASVLSEERRQAIVNEAVQMGGTPEEVTERITVSCLYWAVLERCLAEKTFHHVELAAELRVTAEVHPEDFVYINLCRQLDIDDPREQYLKDGRRSAVQFGYLVEAHTTFSQQDSFELLEFASGYGAMTRHLKNVLPKAAVVASDIHEKAMDFVAAELSVETALSSGDPENFDLGRQFDIVCATSFFSHMPERTWGLWLESLFRHVKNGGCIIFTANGSWSAGRLGPPMPSGGFFFQPGSEQDDLDPNEYGVAITLSDYVREQVGSRLGVPISFYSERFWWETQDVYIVAKAA